MDLGGGPLGSFQPAPFASGQVPAPAAYAPPEGGPNPKPSLAFAEPIPAMDAPGASMPAEKPGRPPPNLAAANSGGAGASGGGGGVEIIRQSSHAEARARRETASRQGGLEVAACFRGDPPPEDRRAMARRGHHSARGGGGAGFPSGQHHGVDTAGGLMSAREEGRSRSCSSSSAAALGGLRVQTVQQPQEAFGAWRESTAWEVRPPHPDGVGAAAVPPIVRRNPILHTTVVYLVNDAGVPERRLAAGPQRVVVENHGRGDWPGRRGAELFGAASGFPSGYGLGSVQAGRPRSAQHFRRKGVAEISDLHHPTQPNRNRHHQAALLQNPRAFNRKKGFCGMVADAANKDPTGKRMFEFTKFPPQRPNSPPGKKAQGGEGNKAPAPAPPAGKPSGAPTPRRPASARGAARPASARRPKSPPPATARRYLPPKAAPAPQRPATAAAPGQKSG